MGAVRKRANKAAKSRRAGPTAKPAKVPDIPQRSPKGKSAKPAKAGYTFKQRPRRKAGYMAGSELERERAKSFKAVDQKRSKQPQPEQHAQPHWAPAETQFEAPRRTVTSRALDGNDPDQDPSTRSHRSGNLLPPPPVPTLGEMITDPHKILNLPRNKIIVDKNTDQTIREQMAEVVPDNDLTTRRLANLMTDGIGACLALWQQARASRARVTSDQFWERVGSSKGWLRRLGARIARDFFMKLCVLYENGSKHAPTNRMMHAVRTLHATFTAENMEDLHPYLVEAGYKSFRNTASRSRQAGRPSVDSDNDRAVLEQLVPITSFGEDERELREARAEELENVGQSSALPDFATPLPIRVAQQRRSHRLSRPMGE